jgi:hypothetical protein
MGSMAEGEREGRMGLVILDFGSADGRELLDIGFLERSSSEAEEVACALLDPLTG